MDHLARAEPVVKAHPAQVLWVFAPGQHVLVAHIVGALVDNPGAALHADGVAAAQVGVEVGAVAVTLIATALEIFVLIENNLKGRMHQTHRTRHEISGRCQYG